MVAFVSSWRTGEVTGGKGRTGGVSGGRGRTGEMTGGGRRMVWGVTMVGSVEQEIGS